MAQLERGTRKLATLLTLAQTASSETPDWSAAACNSADPEAWYPEGHSTPGQAVLTTCARCPIRTECLSWALAHDERFGVWGGATPTERIHLRKVLTAAATPAEGHDRS